MTISLIDIWLTIQSCLASQPISLKFLFESNVISYRWPAGLASGIPALFSFSALILCFMIFFSMAFPRHRIAGGDSRAHAVSLSFLSRLAGTG